MRSIKGTYQDKMDPINNRVVEDFVQKVLIGGNYSKLEDYINTNNFIQHDAHLTNSVNDLRDALNNGQYNYEYIFKLLGQGDHVVTYSKANILGKDVAVFDVYRLEDQYIVEHWINMEEIPPENEWANSGKF